MTWRFKEEDYVKYIENDLRSENLTHEQRQYLMKINSTLAELEKHIRKEVYEKIDQLKKRVEDPYDWINDYEIDIYIMFHLREDDPAYSDEDDNVVVQMWESPPSEKMYERWWIGDGVNHNEFQHWDHLMKDEYHCWLYHSLYDHTDLDWYNILRIGDIWVNIDVTYQKILDL